MQPASRQQDVKKPFRAGNIGRRREPEGKPRNAPYVAVLISAKQTPAATPLLATLGERRITLDFLPVDEPLLQGARIGLLAPREPQAMLAFTMLDVYRGRIGGKPPERLLVLGALSATIQAWPAVRLRGCLKAAARNAVALGGALDNRLCWWLASELAFHGATSHKKLAELAVRLDEPLPVLTREIVCCGDKLVLASRLDDITSSATKALTAKNSRNPFLTELEASQLLSYTDARAGEIAEEVLRRLAKLHKLKTHAGADGKPRVRLAGNLLPPPPAKADAKAAAEITALIESGAGLPRAALALRFPSFRHVIAWLFEAQLLIESAEGYVFTSQQLKHYFAKLQPRFADLSLAGVRDIKDLLGLKRRDAEALRAYLVQMGAATAGEPALARPSYHTDDEGREESPVPEPAGRRSSKLPAKGRPRN